MRLIDADELIYESIDSSDTARNEYYYGTGIVAIRKEDIDDAPTIVEFEGDINKVIVKGEEYHKQLTTMWLNPYSPYTCEHCGFHVDSKTRYCPECGRRASNYEV